MQATQPSGKYPYTVWVFRAFRFSSGNRRKIPIEPVQILMEGDGNAYLKLPSSLVLLVDGEEERRRCAMLTNATLEVGASVRMPGRKGKAILGVAVDERQKVYFYVDLPPKTYYADGTERKVVAPASAK